jgi:hypothetical protein
VCIVYMEKKAIDSSGCKNGIITASTYKDFEILFQLF